MIKRWKVGARGLKQPSGYRIPSDSLRPANADKTQNIYWPCFGVILDVHPCNAESNQSKLYSATRAHTFDSESANGVLQTTQPNSTFYGSSYECDVRILYGLGADMPVVYNAIIPPSFGGLKDMAFVTPKANTNATSINQAYNSDGDWVVVEFIGGDITAPVITARWPHPLNTTDIPSVEDGEVCIFRFNGIEFLIDSNGNTKIDTKNAGIKYSVDAGTGAITLIPSEKNVASVEDVPPGLFLLETNSNIIFNAGEENNQGDILLRSKTSTRVIAQKSDIELYTEGQRQVVIQGNKPNLLEAARRTDKVKISSSCSGTLFKYLEELHKALQSFASVLASSSDPKTAIAASELTAMLQSINTPDYQEGTIIEGSSSCKIGGEAINGI